MRIALVGYGKMGKTIEKLAKERGHSISHIVGLENSADLIKINHQNTDVAIEFSEPEAAFQNLSTLMKAGVPTVCGTTGWLDKKPQIETLCKEHKAAFFYASNFSVGVNLFFKLNAFLANLMARQKDYQVSMTEIHHTQKKDSPSGTGLTLAEGIITNHPDYQSWIEGQATEKNQLPIHSIREGMVPGTHVIHYKSSHDEIKISHEAFGREGFAIGAIMVAEWLRNKTGVFTMEDFLTI
jgi:4-hydroxy-tetrahydrodipicolinate reductase